jgi:GNAT superfamily N-acetyltransferase
MSVSDRIARLGLRAIRTVLGVRRPSARSNARALQARNESLASLLLREATSADIPRLAELHVSAWNDTYAPLLTGPPVGVRERQWRQAFDQPEHWFCYVLVRPDGELVGFTKGVFRADHEIPGELNKLFLARGYQRLGLGRRLVGHVVHRFRAAGLTAMAAYVDPRNPSCGFFERLGGRWLVEPDGRVNFSWYVWRDLAVLERYCTARLPDPQVQLTRA